MRFGDSNSTPPPRDILGYDRTLAADKTVPTFAGYPLALGHHVLGNTPIASWPGANDGPGIVTFGTTVQPEAAVALIRYGIEDVHRDLVVPTQHDVDLSRNAYRQAVQTTLSRGILPVRHTRMSETGENHDTGRGAGRVYRPQHMDLTLMRDFTTGSFGSSEKK